MPCGLFCRRFCREYSQVPFIFRILLLNAVCLHIACVYTILTYSDSKPSSEPVIVETQAPQPQAGKNRSTSTGGRGHDGTVVVGNTPKEDQAPEDDNATTTADSSLDGEPSGFSCMGIHKSWWMEWIMIHSAALFLVPLMALCPRGPKGDKGDKGLEGDKAPAPPEERNKAFEIIEGLFYALLALVFFIVVPGGFFCTSIYAMICLGSGYQPNTFVPYYPALVHFGIFFAAYGFACLRACCPRRACVSPGGCLYFSKKVEPSSDPATNWNGHGCGWDKFIMCPNGHPLEHAYSGNPCSRLERKCAQCE
eukprot:Hpha_TRINITY_DN19989_c0_g1::TRINITY_DN19989_c0_g1_i1::g.93574::m.93574